jgi:hypothetical protein
MKIDGYPIDACTSESLNAESDVTEHPVENGVAIADHVIQKPIEYTCECVVSDTPIGAIALDPTRAAGSGAPLPSRDAFARMMELRETKRTVAIDTVKFGTLQNMELTKFEPKAQSDTGNSLQFSASFKQITVVTNARVAIRTSTPSSGKETNLGALQAGKFTGRYVTWKKGNPPGSVNIVGQEVLAVKDKVGHPRNADGSLPSELRHMLTHAKGTAGELDTTELTPGEYAQFTVDWLRDQGTTRQQQQQQGAVASDTTGATNALEGVETLSNNKDVAAKDPTKGPVQRSMFGQ